VAQDGTVFVAEINGVEAIRDNQKLSTLATPSPPYSIAAHGNVVAVGSEVFICSIISSFLLLIPES
jgi:WD repeat-containing protein 1 (actin-interacting protein 1)